MLRFEGGLPLAPRSLSGAWWMSWYAFQPSHLACLSIVCSTSLHPTHLRALQWYRCWLSLHTLASILVAFQYILLDSMPLALGRVQSMMQTEWCYLLQVRLGLAEINVRRTLVMMIQNDEFIASHGGRIIERVK